MTEKDETKELPRTDRDYLEGAGISMTVFKANRGVLTTGQEKLLVTKYGRYSAKQFVDMTERTTQDRLAGIKKIESNTAKVLAKVFKDIEGDASSNWDKVKVWSKENLDKDEIDDYTQSMKGNMHTQTLVMKEMLRKYQEKNTLNSADKLTNTQKDINKGTVRPKNYISSEDYGKEHNKLSQKGLLNSPEHTALEERFNISFDYDNPTSQE